MTTRQRWKVPDYRCDARVGGSKSPAADVAAHLRKRYPSRCHLDLLAGGAAAHLLGRGACGADPLGRHHRAGGVQPLRVDDWTRARRPASGSSRRCPGGSGEPPAACGRPARPRTFLFGGVDTVYHERMRPGDEITSVITATDLYERSGRLGAMLFYITEETWTKQTGAVVKTTRTTNIAW